jgi:hypothetical protein
MCSTLIPLLIVGCRRTSRSGGRSPSPRPGVILVRRRRHQGQRRLPLPPAPITYHRGSCCRRRRRRRRRCRHHHALTLASAVTIAAASSDVTASPTLLSMVRCGFVCCPLPTAPSAVRIYQPPPSCDRRRFRRRAAVPFCLPSPATVLSLFYRVSIAFAAPVDGWLLHSPPTQQHTNHTTKPKTFPVSTLLDLF